VVIILIAAATVELDGIEPAKIRISKVARLKAAARAVQQVGLAFEPCGQEQVQTVLFDSPGRAKIVHAIFHDEP
jgi:hypothetical protein